MTPRSIAAINQLPESQKREIYSRFIPPQLLEQFDITASLEDAQARSLAEFRYREGSTDFVIELKHEVEAEDPLFFAHLTDTMNGQIHVLLYIVNDPSSERYDVDRMPDGRRTQFGLELRNLEAEEAAMLAGLAPGQIRRGLRSLAHAVPTFEAFTASLGHSVFFIEPMFYHNAVIFEQYGFAYLKGRRRMEELHRGFQPGGPLAVKLDGSTPFRRASSADSILGRSWAVHDGIGDEPYTGVTMYKRLGKNAGINTFPDSVW
ncbi:MAG: hypothetical protein BMS9Abin28_2069 [Anaerolineae bacterium]|nr:MAG: hypothetical protein BMS9Abin28_2069 [Anaerolineae bacterium]